MKTLLAAVLCLLLLPVSGGAQRGRTYKIVAAESNLWVYVAKAGLL